MRFLYTLAKLCSFVCGKNKFRLTHFPFKIDIPTDLNRQMALFRLILGQPMPYCTVHVGLHVAILAYNVTRQYDVCFIVYDVLHSSEICPLRYVSWRSCVKMKGDNEKTNLGQSIILINNLPLLELALSTCHVLGIPLYSDHVTRQDSPHYGGREVSFCILAIYVSPLNLVATKISIDLIKILQR